MKAFLKFILALVRLAIYVVVAAGLFYSAVMWRADIVAGATKLGVPEAIVSFVRDKLDQGTGVVIAVAGRLPVTLPLPMVAAPKTVAQSNDGGANPAGATQAQSGQAPSQAVARPAAPPVSVLTAPVEAATVPVVLDLIGSVQAVASIPVKVRIDSQIVTVEVHEGDHVSAGQTIFTLDSRAILAQIDQQTALINRDQVLVDQTKAEFERTEPLASTKILSPKDLDKARLDYLTAKATLAADKAMLENLKVQSSYYVITSPIDGRVGSLPLKPGSSIRAADALLLATINQTTPVYVSFAVPQVNVAALRNAMRAGEVPVLVTLPGTDGAPLNGKLTFTENQIDAASGTLAVKATVDNQAEILIPGEAVNVRVILKTEPNALTVPEAAVQVGQQGAYLFVLKDDSTVDLRPITIDRKVDGRVVVSSGLKAGDQVVTDGQARLLPNSKVEVRHLPGGQSQPKQQTGS